MDATQGKDQTSQATLQNNLKTESFKMTPPKSKGKSIDVILNDLVHFSEVSKKEVDLGVREKDLLELERKIEEEREELEEDEREFDEWEDELALRGEKLEKDKMLLAAAEKELKEYEKSLQQKERDIEARERGADQFEHDKKRIIKELKKMEKSIIERGEASDRREKRLEELESQLSKGAELAAVVRDREHDIEGKEMELGVERNKIEGLKQELTNRANALEEKASKIRGLEQKLAGFEAEKSRFAEELKQSHAEREASDKALDDLKAQYMKLSKDLEDEIARGDELRSKLAESERALAGARNELEREVSSRSSAAKQIELDMEGKLKEATDRLDNAQRRTASLERRVEEEKNLVQELEGLRENQVNRINELEGELASVRRMMEEKKTTFLGEVERAREDARGEVHEREAALERKTHELAEERERLDKFIEENKKLIEDWKLKDGAIARREEQLQQGWKDISEKEDGLNAARTELDARERYIREAEERARTAGQSPELEEKDRELTKIQIKFDNQIKAIEEMHARLTKQEGDNNSLRKERDSLEEELHRRIREVGQLKMELETAGKGSTTSDKDRERMSLLDEERKLQARILEGVLRKEPKTVLGVLKELGISKEQIRGIVTKEQEAQHKRAPAPAIQPREPQKKATGAAPRGGAPDSWYNKGVALMRSGRYKSAAVCFDNAIKENAKDPEAWYQKGIALLQTGSYGGAFKCLERATELKPELPDAWLFKGISLYELRKYGWAYQAFERALEIDPSSEESMLWSGRAMYKLKRPDKAMHFFEKVLVRDKGNLEAITHLAEVKLELSDFDGALRLCDQGIEIEPGNEVLDDIKRQAIRGMERAHLASGDSSMAPALA